jgi:hypothetical protein
MNDLLFQLHPNVFKLIAKIKHEIARATLALLSLAPWEAQQRVILTLRQTLGSKTEPWPSFQL